MQLDESYVRWLHRRQQPAALPFDTALTIVALVEDPRHAVDVVTSVRAQTVGTWTLWLIASPRPDSPSGQPPRPSWPDDPRVHEVARDTLVAGDGTWLPPGDGEHVVLLDTDCLLAPGALVHVASALRSARPDWLYTDDDCISDAGVRTDPNLKGAFSPELALADDYATRLAVVSRQAIEHSGGLRRRLRWRATLRPADANRGARRHGRASRGGVLPPQVCCARSAERAAPSGGATVDSRAVRRRRGGDASWCRHGVRYPAGAMAQSEPADDDRRPDTRSRRPAGCVHRRACNARSIPRRRRCS